MLFYFLRSNPLQAILCVASASFVWLLHLVCLELVSNFILVFFAFNPLKHHRPQIQSNVFHCRKACFYGLSRFSDAEGSSSLNHQSFKVASRQGCKLRLAILQRSHRRPSFCRASTIPFTAIEAEAENPHSPLQPQPDPEAEADNHQHKHPEHVASTSRNPDISTSAKACSRSWSIRSSRSAAQ